jgi:hypothetical protein
LIKKEILTLILIPAISIVIAVSIFLNFVKLSDISTAIAGAAVGAIVLLSSWGFRHRFENQIEGGKQTTISDFVCSPKL